MVQALQSRYVLMDQVQVSWMLQGDPQYAFVPAGWNDETETTWVR